MKRLIVGFSKGGTFLGGLIRFCTGSNISHVYIRVEIEGPESISLVYHAAGLNVHYVNYAHFLTHQKEIVSEWSVPLSDHEFAVARTQRFTNAGLPYGYKQLIGYLVPVIGQLFGKKLKNPLRDKNSSHVCIETVIEQLRCSETCKKALEGIITESMLPRELEPILASLPGITRIS
jgi:hypothetical protein